MFVIDLPCRNCVSTLSGTESTLHACRLGSECGMHDREINNIHMCAPCLVALACGLYERDRLLLVHALRRLAGLFAPMFADSFC